MSDKKSAPQKPPAQAAAARAASVKKAPAKAAPAKATAKAAPKPASAPAKPAPRSTPAKAAAPTKALPKAPPAKKVEAPVAKTTPKAPLKPKPKKAEKPPTKAPVRNTSPAAKPAPKAAGPKVETKAPAAKRPPPKVDAKLEKNVGRSEAKAQAPEAKPAKPALARPARPEKPAKPPKPEKPQKLAPVAAALAKPIPAKPLAVAAGRAQPVTRTPILPIRQAPKPLIAPKPTAEPELVGDSQPVPAFKSKAAGSKGMVLVGAVAGAFGVKGEVRLRAFTDRREGVISYGPLYGEDGKILMKPKSWRELRDGVAVVASEVKSREDAEKLRGRRLFVPRANLPATAEDEFYIVDLLGCRAEALDGLVLGEICAVWNFGAGDIIEYRPPNGGPNVRITFTRETAPLVDLPGKRVVLDPPAPEPVEK